MIVGESFLAIFVGVATLVGVAKLPTLNFVTHFMQTMRQAAQPVVAPPQTGARGAPTAAAHVNPTPDGAGWTLELEGVEIPSQPAQGRLQGRPFIPDQVVLENSWLKFRQGREFFPDLGLSVVLFEQDLNRLANRTFKVPGKRGVKPQVGLHWKEPGQSLPQQKAFLDRYALRLEFGPIRDGKLPGKIYVCLTDEAKSFLRGTFAVEPKPTPPQLDRRAPRPRPPGKAKPQGDPV